MKMIDKLKKYKELYTVLAFFVGIIASIFIFFHSKLNEMDDILKTLKTTQQMSLKSVIWNDNIALVERASACDVYLNAGYNSMTKKECQVIIERAEEEGSFSYIGKENEYGKQ